MVCIVLFLRKQKVNKYIKKAVSISREGFHVIGDKSANFFFPFHFRMSCECVGCHISSQIMKVKAVLKYF